MNKSLEMLLPKSRELEQIEGRFGIRETIDLYYLERLFNSGDQDEFLAHIWNEIYHKYADFVVSQTIGRKDYFVHRAQASIRERPDRMEIEFDLYIDSFVAQTKQIVIPEITWDYSSQYGYRAKEWRCGYCGSPNEMKERHCTQCGSPRALLIQEI